MESLRREGHVTAGELERLKNIPLHLLTELQSAIIFDSMDFDPSLYARNPDDDGPLNGLVIQQQYFAKLRAEGLT